MRKSIAVLAAVLSLGALPGGTRESDHLVNRQGQAWEEPAVSQEPDEGEHGSYRTPPKETALRPGVSDATETRTNVAEDTLVYRGASERLRQATLDHQRSGLLAVVMFTIVAGLALALPRLRHWLQETGHLRTAHGLTR